ncbi:MexC family multidrug efflux RND transporter periplasmic adaptor subunit [Pseudomonas daroniae]|uniref:MexC family multidrug efflux RND transporter periplasmic adaptor subunit n=1 Tax=Phytopseudomonas daroniae TaxID=2487519 RepID=A0A4V2KB79_9GAMM|nr:MULTISPECIES: MexC family multidrug efflux RND transporter periplasmic adaptor subunit [Pseudomonas]TBU83318.1 MexC family multidrug efflux RND transporter periplasmic adaptor subunit [Pseudomonas daroniae]TBU84957.1 MexC family multidrug efflux RND transporter periplasmic adaptor subunit [Pseudomonas sp. FRB 228]TBU93750.1 MexC family multidrug efflux RND transporter periplasmic adaptor subunit [Pseudomonas daroniae]
MSKIRERWVFSAITLLVAISLVGCDKGEQGWGEAPPREVDVLSIKTEPFTVVAELPGRIEPVRVAEVRARVAGIVLKRTFEEGADVKAGDLLFQIDPAPFKAALSRAQGELARAEAQLFQTQATVKRYEPLVKIDAVSQQDFDVARAALQSAQADKRSAQANVETARLDLGYAEVRAPIAGRIGRAQVTEGALVGQGETTLLARIQQLDPVYADFTQPAADALRLRAAIADGKVSGDGDKTLSLRVDGTDIESSGTLLFTDISVDRSTGQIALRGRFDNPQGVLLPGMYVRVRTPQGLDQDAILVPQRAVQRSADGKASVMLLGADNTVEARPVTTGAMQGARWQIVEGLKAGDQVITSSLAAIRPGITVVPRQPGAETQNDTTPQAQ